MDKDKNPAENKLILPWQDRLGSIQESKEEAELRNFQLNSTRREKGRWVSPGESISVGGCEITGGFFYYGHYLFLGNDFTPDASLVNPSLRITEYREHYRDKVIGYWPSYSRIHPENRSVYLNWLAGDRSDSSIDISYVFIYLYGFERRILVDDEVKGLSPEEHKLLIEELLRLKKLYASHRSFHRYVTRLIDYASVSLYLKDGNIPSLEILTGEKGGSFLFQYLLAETVQNGEAVSPEMALIWLKSQPSAHLKKAAVHSTLFETLFTEYFKKSFKEGFFIKPNKTRLKIKYRAASSTLDMYHGKEFDLPDVSRLSAPLKKLMKIAEKCCEDLEPYNRWHVKNEGAQDSLRAVMLLPPELSDVPGSRRFTEFKNTLESYAARGRRVSLTLLHDLCRDDELSFADEWEFCELADLVKKAGFSLIPHILYHPVALSPEVEFHMIPATDSWIPSKEFSFYDGVISMGTFPGLTEERSRERVFKKIAAIIEEGTSLLPGEKSYLKEYLRWRSENPSTPEEIWTVVQELPAGKKKKISQILIDIALLEGAVMPSKRDTLKILYRALNLEVNSVDGDVFKGIQRGKTSVNSHGSRTPFSLNHRSIEKHEEETGEVQALLKDIFEEPGEEESLPDVQEKTVERDDILTVPGLDVCHSALYNTLITRESWSYEEMEKLCRELKLMVDGAVEVINDMAFERVDAPLIEEDEVFYIDGEILKELTAWEGQE